MKSKMTKELYEKLNQIIPPDMYVCSDDHYGNSESGPLKVIYVSKFIHDKEALSKLGYGPVQVTQEELEENTCSSCDMYFKNSGDLRPFSSHARGKSEFCCEACIEKSISSGFGPGNHEE